MDQENKSKSPKLGWTFEDLATSLSVSVPFLRLEVKRGRLKLLTLADVSFCWIATCAVIWPKPAIAQREDRRR